MTARVIRDGPQAGGVEPIEHARCAPTEIDRRGQAVHEHDGRRVVRARDLDVQSDTVISQVARHDGRR